MNKVISNVGEWQRNHRKQMKVALDELVGFCNIPKKYIL